MNMCKDPEIIPEYEALEKALRQPLLKVFPAAFLGRLSVVPYYPISDGMLSAIIKLQLSKIKARMAEDKGIQFVYDDSVIKQIAKKCTEFESGARMVDAILTHNILPEISNKYLMCLSAGKEIKKVTVKTDGKENFVYKWE
jgi:type VI secretion system protein VasG